MTKRFLLLAAVAAGALLLAACSGSASDDTATTTSAAVSTTAPVTTTTTSPVVTTTAAVTTTTSAPPPGGDGSVSIKNFAFGPGDIIISVGDTVTWTNNEASVAHTTTSDDGIWNSALLQSGDTFDQTFDEAGTFTYFCSIHPSMKGSITVTG